jgi:hypothetical protein
MASVGNEREALDIESRESLYNLLLRINAMVVELRARPTDRGGK